MGPKKLFYRKTGVRQTIGTGCAWQLAMLLNVHACAGFSVSAFHAVFRAHRFKTCPLESEVL